MNQMNVKAVVGNLDKSQIKNSVPTLIEKYIADQKPDNVDVLYLNLYSHERSLNFGLPVVTVQWLSERVKSKRKLMKYDEEQFKCYYSWFSGEPEYTRHIESNEISKEKFIDKFYELKATGNAIFQELDNVHSLLINEQLTISEYNDQVIGFKEELDKLLVEKDELYFLENPTDSQLVELEELNKFISSMHTVVIVASNKSYKEVNSRYLSTLYMDEARDVLSLIK